MYIVSSKVNPEIEKSANEEIKNWPIKIRNTILILDNKGKSKNFPKITFEIKELDNYSIDSINAISFQDYSIIFIGYTDIEHLIGKYYLLNNDLKHLPQFITYTSGMGSGEFLSNMEEIFEANQFCFRLYEINKNQNAYLNKEIIGDNYHYETKLTKMEGNLVGIQYSLVINRELVKKYIVFDFKKGRIVQK
jgi:hypothetical protein